MIFDFLRRRKLRLHRLLWLLKIRFWIVFVSFEKFKISSTVLRSLRERLIDDCFSSWMFFSFLNRMIISTSSLKNRTRFKTNIDVYVAKFVFWFCTVLLLHLIRLRLSSSSRFFSSLKFEKSFEFTFFFCRRQSEHSHLNWKSSLSSSVRRILKSVLWLLWWVRRWSSSKIMFLFVIK